MQCNHSTGMAGTGWALVQGMLKTTESVLTVVTATYLQHQELVHSKPIHWMKGKRNFPEQTLWIEWCACMHMYPSVQRWNKFISSPISHFRQKATKLRSETYLIITVYLSSWTFSILCTCLYMPEITYGYHLCRFYLGGQQDLEVLEIQEDLDHQCQGCLVGLEVLVVHLVQGHLKEHSCLVKYWTWFRDTCFQSRVPAHCTCNLILACKQTLIWQRKKPTLQRLFLKARDLSSLSVDCIKFMFLGYMHIYCTITHIKLKRCSPAKQARCAGQYRPWSRAGVNELLTLCTWKHSASKWQLFYW